MVEGIQNTHMTGSHASMFAEYQDVVDALQKAFPEKPELEIQQAITSYLKSQVGKEAGEMDSKAMLEHITRTFNVAISTEMASEIKKEWEDLTKSMDLGISGLATLLTDYSDKGIDKTDREFLVMLWQMLQGSIEDAIGDESQVSLNANKEAQQKEFQEFLDKKIEEMEKAGKTGFWNKLLKWAGVVASLIGAAVACVVAGAAIATGVGAPAAALLITAAVIMCALAVEGTVAAIGEEFGKDTSLFSQIGKGVAKLLKALGADIDEDKFAMWTAFAIKITLTVVAIACSFGAGAVSGVGAAGSGAASGASAASSSASTGAQAASTAANTATAATKLADTLNASANLLKMISAGMGVATGVIQAGSAIANYQLAELQAELLKLKALLEKLAETQNMEQELANKILQIIFEAMRGNVAEAMDTILGDLDLAVSMNLNKA